jgi:helix-turn-helix protein
MKIFPIAASYRRNGKYEKSWITFLDEIIFFLLSHANVTFTINQGEKIEEI